MEDEFLYLKIAESIRQSIADGIYKAGETLPSFRDLAASWKCTLGTVQRAMRTLSEEGLITSHVGKRSRVAAQLTYTQDHSLRRANLIHRAESFLLDVFTTGYTPSEVEDAFRTALNRWHAVSQESPGRKQRLLKFAGSHDLAIAWIATHFSEITPNYRMNLKFTGSLAGLKMLAAGKADIAGTHLWEHSTGVYNEPFLRELFPQKTLAMIHLAQRRIGLIIKKGNPRGIHSLEDLTRTDVRFINRQAGSGTRVLLDSLLREKGIQNELIQGYGEEKTTHSEIAVAVGEDLADVGLGLEAAAKSFGLDFIFLSLERYDLVVLQEVFPLSPIQELIHWLQGEEFRTLLNGLGGYESSEGGQVKWIYPQLGRKSNP